MKRKFRLIALSLALVLTLSITATASTVTDPRGVLQGDANMDGTIDIFDALEILKRLAGMPSTVEKDIWHPVGSSSNGGTPATDYNGVGFARSAIPADAVRLEFTSATAVRGIGFDLITSGSEDADGTERVRYNPDSRRLTIRRGGTYVLSSAGNDFIFGGQIYINAFERPRVDGQSRVQEAVILILDGVTIENNFGPAIYTRRASKVDLVLVDGSTNTLRDQVNYTPVNDPNDPQDNDDIEPSGVVFVQADLEIRGHGTLNIIGRERHGIVTRDDLNIRGGRFNINTAIGNAVDGNGILGRDSVTISGGQFEITAANHGIRSNNIMSSRRQPTDANKFTTTPNTGDSGFILITNGRFTIRAMTGQAIRADVDVRQNHGAPPTNRNAGGVRIMGGRFDRMDSGAAPSVNTDD